jgi:PAS domain S-box-containing protein
MDQVTAPSIERLFELSIDMLGTATLDGYFTILNSAWTRSLGWSIDTLKAEPYISFVHPDDVEATLQYAENLLRPGTTDTSGFENRYRTSTGKYRWLQWNITRTELAYYFVVHDTTVRHEESERTRQQAHVLRESQDFATGLSNCIAEGIFALDHDGRVTYLNATAQSMLGWSEAELLDQYLHKVVHFERLDGSAYPLEDCPILRKRTMGEIVRVERDIFIRRDGSRLPVSYSSSPIQMEGNFGAVVVFDDITERLDEEIRAERELDKLSWIGRIQDAMAHDRFVLYAQPIMNLRTKEVSQHELLIRMKDENGDIVLPGRFLPAAEEFGLILDIDRWVVQQSAILAGAGHKVEFNLSAKSLGLGMVNIIESAIRASGAPPENLVCEITETALMNDNSAGELFVKSLQELGCKVALDDFGVGYGGLAYLKRLPVSYLKVDMQFVSDLVEMETSRHVVRAIVDLARGFGAQTIAEGAEDGETVRILAELGVDFVQGFYVAHPRPVQEVLGDSPRLKSLERT